MHNNGNPDSTADTTMIKLQSIARQKTADSAMEELFAAEITVTDGLLGHAVEDRGITVLSKESWVKACHETDLELPWLAHGANLLIKGFEFLPTDTGRSLRIGDVLLEITGHNEPGRALEALAPALYEALGLGWRGGVICKVLRSGNIQTGDTVDIVD